MIRIRLINEGRVVKQITSRLHESVVLEQVKKYKDPYDTIQLVEGELSEGAKEMLHHVAKKIVPAALAAGVALSGAHNAQAQGGANPNYPGLNHSIGQHMADIFSPNYKEAMRQREYQRNTERQVWNAEQDEIRKQRVADARAAAGGGGVQKHVIYDQSRLSKDGKSYIVYGIDNTVRRIPVAGTEYMAGDSQRLPHYITSGGAVLYVRHPHAVTESAELKQAKRKYNQAAKDANADQAGAGKKIDTMKNSLRQKDINKQGVAEGADAGPTIKANKIYYADHVVILDPAIYNSDPALYDEYVRDMAGENLDPQGDAKYHKYELDRINNDGSWTVRKLKPKGVAEGLKDTVKQKAKEFGKYMTEPDTPQQAVVRDRAKNIAKIRKNKEQGVAEVNELPGKDKVQGATATPAPSPALKRILMSHIDELREFVKYSELDPTGDLFFELAEHFMNEIPIPVRQDPLRLERRIRNMIAPYAKFYTSTNLMNGQGVAEADDIGYHQTSGTKAGYTVSSRKLSNKPQASNSDVTLQSGSMHHRGKSYNFPEGTLFTQLPGGIFAKHPSVPETHPGFGHLIRRSEDNIHAIHNALNGEQGVAEGYTVTRGIDKERYQERPGLEGPFSTRSGKVVYYDPKEGKYYDPETDFYIGHEDYAKMDEGVAESLPLNDALKVLRQYGAENLKTTTNELHFYKNGKAFSVPLTFNDDATRSVPLSSLNSATRGLKGQGVAEDATVGTIPASGTVGTSGGTGRTQFAPTGKTTNAKFNKNGQIELDTEQEADGSVNLDADAVKQLQQAGVQIKEGEDSPVASAIARRIMSQRTDLLQQYGPVLVMQAIDEVSDFVGDVEEIGSSDVSGWVKHVEQMLQENPPEAFGEGLNEGSDTLEGILSKYSADYAKFKAGGDIDENQDFFDALYEYYFDEMPYGVAKGRTGDPYEWITDRLDQEAGVAPVVEAEEDEATPGEQASADQNIIMQIRKASDYEKPTKIQLADGTESVIAPNIAKQILAKFDKMKPDSKALLQDTLNTEEGFKEILAYFGGGVREQAAARAGNIIQSAMSEAGYYGRRDAYQRDYDSSVSGMGKRQSYAYQQDGGANDEGWDREEYQAPQETYYIRINGKLLKKDGQPFTFRDKAAANKAALTMMAKPFNSGKKFTLTTSPTDSQA